MAYPNSETSEIQAAHEGSEIKQVTRELYRLMPLIIRTVNSQNDQGQPDDAVDFHF